VDLALVQLSLLLKRKHSVRNRQTGLFHELGDKQSIQTSSLQELLVLFFGEKIFLTVYYLPLEFLLDVFS
jgi:hypothetical protein